MPSWPELGLQAPDFWRRDNGFARLLSPIGAIYALATRTKHRFAKPMRLGIPVICVGNLTAGGAGKTPVVLDLAARLRTAGSPVHLLTRGYGGREAGPLLVDTDRHDSLAVGDEALLLARAAPTWVSRDRAAGGTAARDAGARVVVMDDGYQNFGLHKDLSLVVADGALGFGNRRPIPAGPLREFIGDGLARADALVVMGEDRTNVARFAPDGLPVLRASLEPGPEIEPLRGTRVVAFAGIARPEKFFEMLAAEGCLVAASHPFADHYPYRPADVEPILSEARELGATVVTTAKDAVRLSQAQRAVVAVVGARVAWADPEAPDQLLRMLPP